MVKSLTEKDVYIENSASKKCFGKTIKEIDSYIKTNNLKKTYIVFDTQHWYATRENEKDVLKEIITNPKIAMIHVNGMGYQMK